MKRRIVLSLLWLLAGFVTSRAEELPGEVRAVRDSFIIVVDSTGHVYEVPKSVVRSVKKQEEKRQTVAPTTLIMTEAPQSATTGSAAAEKASQSRAGERTQGGKKERFQRIDREIQQLVFIPKGQVLLGGTVSYSEHEEDNLNFLVLKDVEGLGYSFSVSPYIGYFFRDNMAVGARFAYSRTHLDLKNFDLNLGEDFNISLKDLYYLEHKYEASAFLRSYMPIGHSKVFGFFNEARLTYGYSQGKNSTGSGTEYDGTYETVQNLQIGMAPGLTAFITNFASVEVAVGVMGFNFKWQDQKTNQVETGKRRTSSGKFKIDLFSISIGMSFYL